MSSPITLSGFNNVDFGLIIDAILEQERAPIQTLDIAKASQRATLDAYGTLGSRLASIESARNALAEAGAFESYTATVADDTVLGVSTSAGADAGNHTIQVNQLAKTQILASATSVAASTTAVADGGSITIGSETYNVTASTTLEELRDQINADTNADAKASIIDTGSGFKLVLTALSSGTASAFTVQNNLTLGGGSSPITFTDTDTDGFSGDSAADNAVAAADADVLINGIAVTRSSNTISGAIAGVDLNLKSVGTTSVQVDPDVETAKAKVQSLVDAYNEFSSFIQSQFLTPEGTSGVLAGDSLSRSVSSEIRSILRSSFANSGSFSNLTEIGVGFDRDGSLTIDDTVLTSALTNNAEDVEQLFQTTDTGVADRLDAVFDTYLGTSGLLESAEDRIDDSIQALDGRIAALEERLILREEDLRRQFAAADQAISTLNAQQQSLGGIFA